MFNLIYPCYSFLLCTHYSPQLNDHPKNFVHRTLIENAVDAIFVHETGGRIVEVNQPACDSLGYTREELLAASVADFTPDFQQEGFASKADTMPLGEPAEFEDTLVRKDGTVFPVEVRRTALMASGRKVIVALVRDITRRRVVEERIARESAKLKAVVDHLDQGITLFDSDGNLVLHNEKFKQFLGLPDTLFQGGAKFADIAGWTIKETRPEEEVEERLAAALERVQRGEHWQRVVRRPNGLVLEWSSNPIPAGGFVVTCTDITERKRSEEALALSESRFRAFLHHATAMATLILQIPYRYLPIFTR